MTPLQLENLFQLYKDRINTSVSTYTNVLEKHIIKHVVDTHKNIDYYYSDFIEKKKGEQPITDIIDIEEYYLLKILILILDI